MQAVEVRVEIGLDTTDELTTHLVDRRRTMIDKLFHQCHRLKPEAPTPSRPQYDDVETTDRDERSDGDLAPHAEGVVLQRIAPRNAATMAAVGWRGLGCDCEEQAGRGHRNIPISGRSMISRVVSIACEATVIASCASSTVIGS